jgi:hypothetical protein
LRETIILWILGHHAELRHNVKSLRAKHFVRIRPGPEGAAAVTRTVLMKSVNERLTSPLKTDPSRGVPADGIVLAAFFSPGAVRKAQPAHAMVCLPGG